MPFVPITVSGTGSEKCELTGAERDDGMSAISTAGSLQLYFSDTTSSRQITVNSPSRVVLAELRQQMFARESDVYTLIIG